MFPLRQTLRIATRLTLTRDSSLRQIPQIYKGPIVKFPRQIVFRTNSTQCPEQNENVEENKKVLAKLEGKFKLMFTCKRCDTRNSKVISKLAYEKGVVIVRCDGCKNNHLIADNLGWFETRNRINIERIMAEKGEKVRKILNDEEGYIEAVAYEELRLLEERKNEKPVVVEEDTVVKVKYEKVGDPEKS